MMLEDESGRLRITGDVHAQRLGVADGFVTGCVIAALGTEQADGSFRVIATQHAGLPPQPARWARSPRSGRSEAQQRAPAGKLAIVSGLEMAADGDGDDACLDMLMEWLEGSAGAAPSAAAGVTRLLVVGNSLGGSGPIATREAVAARKRADPEAAIGFDAAPYATAPTDRLDRFLVELLPTLPVTLLPGASDPASVAVPQRPLHAAMFPRCLAYARPPGAGRPHRADGEAAAAEDEAEGDDNDDDNVSDADPDEPAGPRPRRALALDCVTNPWQGDIAGWRVLCTGGQTIADALKYLPEPPSSAVLPSSSSSSSRAPAQAALDVMAATLRWRLVAPTAPDTLWAYPFQDDDPLLLRACPHVYVAGNMAALGVRRLRRSRRSRRAAPRGDAEAGDEEPEDGHDEAESDDDDDDDDDDNDDDDNDDDDNDDDADVLLLSVPSFRRHRTLVLLDLDSLAVEAVQFGVVGPSGSGGSSVR